MESLDFDMPVDLSLDLDEDMTGFDAEQTTFVNTEVEKEAPVAKTTTSSKKKTDNSANETTVETSGS